jgi:sigma-B regulation protein RsbU (phosphoserine phosphatase)
MKILIAEDERVSRLMLEHTLGRWGYEVEACSGGAEALKRLDDRDGPLLAILDWNMPDLSGPEICRQVGRAVPLYVILLTANISRDNLVEGLEAGADDYVTKPFEPRELRARIRVGERMMALQGALEDRIAELQAAVSRISDLEGLLPICAYCKKIRDDRDYWNHLEVYISDHSAARFSHGICPGCFEKQVQPQLESLGPRHSSETTK